MLLRVVLCTFIVYQAVNANGGGLEAYEDNPSVDYFWTTIRQIMLHFVDVWNSDNPANTVSRETLQEIWYPLERSFKDKIGSRSWMRISTHFKETLTHPQAAATLETLFSCIHRLLLRNGTKEVKDLYKGLDKRAEAWQNLYDLKKLFIKEFFKIQEDEKLKKPFNVIKGFFIRQMKRSLADDSSSRAKHDKNSEKSSKEGKKSQSKKNNKS